MIFKAAQSQHAVEPGAEVSKTCHDNGPWVIALVRFVSRHERVERIIEGDPDVLIENGRVKADCLRNEAISEVELAAAAHKQGFASLDQIDRAVLDPNGSIAFFGKQPTPDMTRHDEIIRRLDQMAAQLAEMNA